MLRLTEVKLPLDHTESAIRAAILKRLGIGAGDLSGFTVFRRAVDARKPAIAFIYTLDVEVRNEAAILKRFDGDRHVTPAPDASYRFVAQAFASPAPRPVVIGTGPAGCSPACCWPRWGSGPSSSSAARRCASAPAIPGDCGANRC